MSANTTITVDTTFIGGICEKCQKLKRLYRVSLWLPAQNQEKVIYVCFSCYDRLKKDGKIVTR